MSALAFNLLRIAYLVLLWLFVLFAIGVLRRDLLTQARATIGAKRGKRKEAEAAGLAAIPTAAAPAPAPFGAAPPFAAPPGGPMAAGPAQPAGYEVGGIALPPGAPPPAGSEPRKPRRHQRAETTPHPTPAPTELIVTAGSLIGTRIPLASSSVLIGRAPGSTLVINDDFASSRHARIFQQNGAWYLEDLGSTNGTFIGGQRVAGIVPLAAGAAVQIGQSMIELR